MPPNVLPAALREIIDASQWVKQRTGKRKVNVLTGAFASDKLHAWKTPPLQRSVGEGAS